MQHNFQYVAKNPNHKKTPQAQATLHGRGTFVAWAVPILFAKIYYCNHWAPWGIKELIKTSENAQLHKIQCVNQILEMDYEDACISACTYTQRML